MIPAAAAWAEAFPEAVSREASPPLWLGAVRLFTPDLDAALPGLIKRLRPRSISTGHGSAVLVVGATVIFVEECFAADPAQTVVPFFDMPAPLEDELWAAFQPSAPAALAVGGHQGDGFPALVLSTRL